MTNIISFDFHLNFHFRKKFFSHYFNFLHSKLILINSKKEIKIYNVKKRITIKMSLTINYSLNIIYLNLRHLNLLEFALNDEEMIKSHYVIEINILLNLIN